MDGHCLIRASWSPAPLGGQWLCIHAIESVTSVCLLSVGRLRRRDAPAEACKCALREGCGFVCGGRSRHVRGQAPRSPSGNGYGYSATQMLLLSPMRCKRCEVSNTSDQAPVRSYCNCHGDVSARRAACSRAVTPSQCSCANYAGRREQLGVAPARIGKTRRVG